MVSGLSVLTKIVNVGDNDIFRFKELAKHHSTADEYIKDLQIQMFYLQYEGILSLT